MRLALLHPGVAYRDCAHCLKFQYDENSGKPVETRKGSGEFFPRYSPPVCQTTGCPKGTPENPLSLTSRNDQAFWHYLECRAVGAFPDDPIVRRNAAIIRAAEEAVQRDERRQFERTLIELVVRRG